MLARYHRQITHEALGMELSSRALDVVIAANLGQDCLQGLIGHPEYHFDNSQFSTGQAYVDSQRWSVRQHLAHSEDSMFAWQAFGRLSHAVQDFYAHSNYVALWLQQLASHLQSQELDVFYEQIESLDPLVLDSSELCSGRIYYPWDALGFIPILELVMLRWQPSDSHTCMNLDRPERSPLFPYAMVAARKRTQVEFHRIVNDIPLELVARFTSRDPEKPTS
jgi:hypothetical protein